MNLRLSLFSILLSIIAFRMTGSERSFSTVTYAQRRVGAPWQMMCSHTGSKKGAKKVPHSIYGYKTKEEAQRDASIWKFALQLDLGNRLMLQDPPQEDPLMRIGHGDRFTNYRCDYEASLAVPMTDESKKRVFSSTRFSAVEMQLFKKMKAREIINVEEIANGVDDFVTPKKKEE